MEREQQMDSEEWSEMRPFVSDGSEHSESTGYIPGAARDWWRSISTSAVTGHRDFVNASVSHEYTSAELQKLAGVESIDYFPANSYVYRTWLKQHPQKRTYLRWIMMWCIGTAVGLVGYLLYSAIDILASFKLQVLRQLLEGGDLGLGWLFCVVYSVGLALLSSAAVVYVAPAAGGSGIPEVMAFLNGVQLPKVFNLECMAVKWISCVFAIGSGLPVGPEGPMIHLGAMIGAALSQGESTTLGCAMPCAQREGFFGFKGFRNNKDKRDFITSGVAAGVAVAFGAPVGGLLFAFEEVASFWQQTLGWQIFFCCMCGVFASSLFKSAEKSLDEGHFGLFDTAWSMPYEAQELVSTHAVAVVPAAVLGLCCGVMGGLFTFLNVKVARLRKAFIGQNKIRQMAEPCAIMFIIATMTVLVPLGVGCTSSACVILEDTHELVCPEGTSTHLRTIVEEDLVPYVCGSDGTNTTKYNELATLMHVTGEDAIRHLFSRGTHREFSYGTLITFLIIYFVGAGITAGSAISSGLFVPMLLIGGMIGRLGGLLVVDITAYYGYGDHGVFQSPSAWSWIDPGVFALLGAGAFMAGVCRLTLSLAVIIMEMSNEVHFMLPILVSVMVAKWVADAMTHSLYHCILDVKCIPFLPNNPEHSDLDAHAVEEVMHRGPIVTLRETEHLTRIRDVLRDYTHNGFPVVRTSQVGDVCVGLILRSHLKVLLRRAGLGSNTFSAHDGLVHLDVSYEELDERIVSHRARRFIEGQEQLLLDSDTASDADTPANHRYMTRNPSGPVIIDENQRMDLSPYVNTSALCVHTSFSVQRTYILFRTLGLRHLVVVDDLNRVIGMVTRKNLLGQWLQQKLKPSGPV
eukprot:CAMPEP_0118923936 /NCGR_PEP_ID=MMETSP1169-20130426/2280_1 /TAXON_ID=36882 /ORGANISM="Pyramimonas obovata, Strain CCMP722" /LENGTH=856 /DNA_ID=CAMNT_0006864997 /DNA_START=214 /DNA_END=2784 /DNA_ORIENTATION=+